MKPKGSPVIRERAAKAYNWSSGKIACEESKQREDFQWPRVPLNSLVTKINGR